jgi:hypothetical protein
MYYIEQKSGAIGFLSAYSIHSAWERWKASGRRTSARHDSGWGREFRRTTQTRLFQTKQCLQSHWQGDQVIDGDTITVIVPNKD